MWTYQQRSGELAREMTGCRLIVAYGYSGHGEHRNDPRAQTLHDVGPIPCGDWEIVGEPFDSPRHGPFCLRLEPGVGTETFGRAGFLMHGDSKEHPGEASKGCIIVPRDVREKVWHSGERLIRVVESFYFPEQTNG